MEIDSNVSFTSFNEIFDRKLRVDDFEKVFKL